MNSIEPLKSGDFQEWIELWDKYLAFYKTSVPESTSKANFARLTDDTDYMGGFLCRDEQGSVIGFVHWILHPSTWTLGDYCYLQDLYVSDTCRTNGHGRALIDAVNGLAKGRGCDRVYWLTQESNTTARYLYDAVADNSGFIQYRQRLS